MLSTLWSRFATIPTFLQAKHVFRPIWRHVESRSDSIKQAKLQLIMAEYELLRFQNVQNCPENLTQADLDYLLSLKKYKRYKRITWLDVSHRLREKALRSMRDLENGIGLDQITLPFVGAEHERLFRRKQLSLIPYSQNVVFDISFDEHMSSLECKNLAEQLLRIIDLNKFGIDGMNDQMRLDPFCLHMTNLSSSSTTSAILHNLLGNSVDYPNVFLHDQPLTELFPKSNLVYLSPHSKETMTTYDPNVTYIIGGIVDRRQIIELTTHKCQQLNLKSVRLPLDEVTSKQVQSLDDVFKLLCVYKLYGFNNQVSKRLLKYIFQKNNNKLRG